MDMSLEDKLAALGLEDEALAGTGAVILSLSLSGGSGFIEGTLRSRRRLSAGRGLC